MYGDETNSRSSNTKLFVLMNFTTGSNNFTVLPIMISGSNILCSTGRVC